MKRRSSQPRKRRARKFGTSRYHREGKVPYKYSFPTGQAYADRKARHDQKEGTR